MWVMGRALVLMGASVALLADAHPAAAQNQPKQKRGDRTRYAEPGEGPRGRYLEDDWRNWWYLNHERCVDLRARLRAARTGLDAATSPLRPQVYDAWIAASKETNPELASAALMAMAKSGDPVLLPALTAGLDHAAAEVKRYGLVALGIHGQQQSVVRLAEVAKSDREPWERVAAMLGLGFHPDPASSAILNGLLEPTWWSKASDLLKRGLALAIGVDGDASAVPTIRALLQDKELSGLVRGAFAWTLGTIGSPADRDCLLELLDHDDVAIRRGAALGLGKLLRGSGDTVAMKKLWNRVLKRSTGYAESTELLRDIDALIIGEIAGTGNDAASRLSQLIDIGASSVVRLVTDSSNSSDAFAALGAALTGPLPVSVLNRLAGDFTNSSHEEIRAALAIALGMSGNAGLAELPKLKERIRPKAGNPDTQAYYVLALGLAGSDRFLESHLAHLADSTDSEQLQTMAIGVALMHHAEEAQEVLLARLTKDKSEHSQRAVLAALGWIGDAAVVPVLIGFLTNPLAPDIVRVQAAVALGNLFDPAPRRAVLRLYDNIDYWIDSEQFYFDFLMFA